MKIPVIGTAIVNGVHWLQRLLDSVDYPVENFVIFNNNGKGEITEELDKIANTSHPLIDKITVCHLPANIGLPCVFNMVIKCYLNAPYWIMTNHDIAFTPNLLREMKNAADDKEVGMVHGKSGDFGLPGYDLFLIKDWVVQKYGLFDENFYPAYCEDADYIMRTIKNPVNYKVIGIPYLHGETTDYYESGGQTKKEDPTLRSKLDEVNIINFEYGKS